jgi:hypothetical protein
VETRTVIIGLKAKIVIVAIWEDTYFGLGKTTQPQVVGGVDGEISYLVLETYPCRKAYFTRSAVLVRFSFFIILAW